MGRLPDGFPAAGDAVMHQALLTQAELSETGRTLAGAGDQAHLLVVENAQFLEDALVRANISLKTEQPPSAGSSSTGAEIRAATAAGQSPGGASHHRRRPNSGLNRGTQPLRGRLPATRRLHIIIDPGPKATISIFQ